MKCNGRANEGGERRINRENRETKRGLVDGGLN